MKRLLSVFTLAIALFAFAFTAPAFAGDAANGAKIFSSTCAACHMGGGNVVMANKTLKKEALEQYGMDSIEAITNQIKQGKNAMPSFLGRLNDSQIEDVATYVLEQAEKGW
ncbi:MAG: cytochrome C6 [Cyanobacteria bacterium J007]|nr:MAG: cytochrome C6 [Cyanobacteria bacterium J007]